jgi:uncharacterized membrane protein
VAPVFLGQVLSRTSHALAGVVVFILLSASIVVQLGLRRLSDRRALVIGCALLAGGVGLLALALGVEYSPRCLPRRPWSASGRAS